VVDKKDMCIWLRTRRSGVRILPGAPYKQKGPRSKERGPFCLYGYTREVFREPPQGSTSRPKAGAGRRLRRRPEGVSPAKPDSSILPPSARTRSSSLASGRRAQARLSRAGSLPQVSPTNLFTSHHPQARRPSTKPPPHSPPPTLNPKNVNNPDPKNHLFPQNQSRPSPLPCLLSTIQLHCAQSGRRIPTQKAADSQQTALRLNLSGSGP